MSSSTPSLGSPDPGDDFPFHRLRFIHVLFCVPERTFAYIAVGLLNWKPAKFLSEFGELTFKEIEKELENQLIWRGLPRSLIRHVFQRLRHILRNPPVRDRAPLDDRPLNAYKLNEFLDFLPEEKVASWNICAEALIEVERQKSAANDARFDDIWARHRDELVRVLRRYRRSYRVDAEDIAQLVWLAIHMAHDTGADWDFDALLRVGRDILGRESDGRGLQLEFLDELAVLDLRDEGRRRPIPAYVKVAILEALLDGARLSHRVVAFLSRLLFEMPPREIVKQLASRSLFDLNYEIFELFLRYSSIPEPVLRELFGRFDRRLCQPLESQTGNARLRRSHQTLLDKVIGDTRLKDYMKSRGPDARADEIGRWYADVLRYLKKKARTPGTPLFLAMLRWRNEDPEDGDD